MFPLRLLAVALALWAASARPLAGSENPIFGDVAARVPVTLPAGARVADARYGGGASLFLRAVDASVVWEVSVDTGKVRSVPTPELARLRAAGALRADFAVGPYRRLYFPAFWKDGQGTAHSVLIAVDADSGASRAIELNPPGDIQSAAVDGGAAYAAGLDTDYWRKLAPEQATVRKYTIDGRLSGRWTGAETEGRTFAEQRLDARHGRLWVEGGRVYDLQAYSRRMRVFDTGGRMVDEVRFTPPAAGGAEQEIWPVLPVANGRYLAQWIASSTTGAGVVNGPYFCVHDGTGAPVSAAANFLARAFPVFDDGGGRVVFLHEVPAGGGWELLRAGLR